MIADVRIKYNLSIISTKKQRYQQLLYKPLKQ